MSSTNRSDARNFHISDYYVTPQKPILDLFKQLTTKLVIDEIGNLFPSDPVSWLDPCAGGDPLNLMAYPTALNTVGVKNENIKTIDIRQDSLAEHKLDYLDVKLKKAPDVIITNPPFSLAKEIIQKAMLDVNQTRGVVIMLLRLNFFGSKDRKDFWENNMPLFTFVHRNRISFLGNFKPEPGKKKGSTDSIEYMHCIWKVNQKQNFTRLEIL